MSLLTEPWGSTDLDTGDQTAAEQREWLLEWNKLVQPVKSPPLPDNIGRISTPLQLPAWAKALKHYPNKEVALFFLGGIAHDFRIGFILVLGNITILP